jgi:colanic acid biosynthesis protein WcaH
MYIEDSIYKQIITCLPILCVDLLILHDEKCLLLRRANHPAFGQLWFPGGRVHKLEKLQDAATRLAIQETGLHCRFEKIVSVEESIFLIGDGEPSDKHTVNVCCKMQLESPPSQISLDSLHSAYEWISNLRPDMHEAVRHPLTLLGFSLGSASMNCEDSGKTQTTIGPT